MTKEFTVRYTNKDIMDKIDEVQTELTRLTEHVTTQNGRVLRLEKGTYHFKDKCDKRFNLIYKTFGATLLTVVGWIILILMKNG